MSAVVVQLRLGKRQRHPVVGEEYHDRVFGFATLVECLEDFAHAIIRTPHAGIVQSEFLPHFRIVEKKTGDRHFIRLENPRWHMRILATTLDLAPKRLVRIGHIHHKTKRFARSLCLLDAIGRGDPERIGILVMPFFSVRQRVEIGIPSVRLVRSGVRHLAPDAGEVTCILHQVDHVRPAGILHLIKAFDLVVVGDQAGEHNVAPGHAIANGHVRVGKAQALLGQAIDIRRGVGQLGAERPDRVRAHIVHSDH